MASFPVGSQLTLKAVFRTAEGEAANPSTVTMDLKDPAGVVTTYSYLTDNELTRTSTGHYEFLLVFDTAGTWYARWNGTGSLIAHSRDIPLVIAPTIF